MTPKTRATALNYLQSISTYNAGAASALFLVVGVCWQAWASLAVAVIAAVAFALLPRARWDAPKTWRKYQDDDLERYGKEIKITEHNEDFIKQMRRNEEARKGKP